MKNVKYMVVLVMFMVNGMAYAQKPFMDTVCVQIDNKAELELAVNDYAGLNEKLGNDLKRLQSLLNETDRIPEGVPYTITYVPDKSLSIKQSEQSERIIWKGDDLIRYPLDNQCVIHSDSYSLLVRFNDIERLTSDSLLIKIKEVVNSTDKIQGRFAATYNYEYIGEKLIHNDRFDKLNGQLDAISLNGGVGVNLVKNKPVLDLTAQIGLVFSKKGLFKNHYYLSYNQLSHFDDESNIHLNSFANIGYRHNLSNDPKSPDWLGVEFGYLVSRNGDLFDKNTFRIGINWEVGKYISVSPQLYLSDKSTYPGLRIGFGF